ncbi:hypothetical protein [Thiobaca trueperi]|uniref:hypothetical protein n=1 Tax=Thiobaca trueperi TaxID=127458 RepID=UPI0010436121|nr:hypothetical protein [Thiobaca trueperi]
MRAGRRVRQAGSAPRRSPRRACVQHDVEPLAAQGQFQFQLDPPRGADKLLNQRDAEQAVPE